MEKIKARYLIEKSGKKVGDIVEVDKKLADFLVKKGDVELVEEFENKNKLICFKCKKYFKGNLIDESHNVPCYLFDGDRPRQKKQADKFGISHLCGQCHKKYDFDVLKLLFLNLKKIDIEIKENENNSHYMKLINNLPYDIRLKGIKICEIMRCEFLK